MKNNINHTLPLPSFSTIDPNTLENRLDQQLADNRASLEALLTQKDPYSWENLMDPLEALDDALQQCFSPVSHLTGVKDSPALRNAYNTCLPKLSDYHNEIGQNKTLFKAIESITQQPDYSTLNSAQKKVIENALRDFRLSGVDLPDDKKKRFADLSKKLTQLTTKFSENVLDATQAWSYHTDDEKTLTGLPDGALAQAEAKAKTEKKSGWVLGLDMPTYTAVMTYAENRQLRETFYEAYTTRASDQGPQAGQWDNTPVMHDILATRYELAALLGFENYAEHSLATKMVKETSRVLDFLNALLDASLPKAQEERQTLSTFAKETLGITQLAAWDTSFAAEKLRQAQYDFSQEALRAYFPAPQVVSGLFEIVHLLFGITLRPITDADTWHPDVLCYAVCSDDEVISHCYLDLYAREGKRSGAWMDDGRLRRRLPDGTIQSPIAYIVCNFDPPSKGQPALLRHDDVVTLFHEFGHALQHMLTTIDYADVSGINGVPWDAVELASQFLENWAIQKTSIPKIAKHVTTGEALPDALYEKLWAARNFQSALLMCRQLEFALFDFKLHLLFDPTQEQQIQTILDAVRKRIGLIPTPNYNRFQHGFSHIFAGGYAAGYYSYKWAEVMAADAFSLFLENGIFDKPTSKRFLETILQSGGSEEPLALFCRFRGREPDVNALLELTGIAS